LYPGFRIGRHTVAERWTITPAADYAQHYLIFAGSSAVQNEWAMHSSIGTYDKADAHAQVFIVQLK
jgi:hypothetical protein